MTWSIHIFLQSWTRCQCARGRTSRQRRGNNHEGVVCQTWTRNVSHLVAYKIWLRSSVSPRRLRANRTHRGKPQPCLLVHMSPNFDLRHTARNCAWWFIRPHTTPYQLSGEQGTAPLQSAPGVSRRGWPMGAPVLGDPHHSRPRTGTCFDVFLSPSHIQGQGLAASTFERVRFSRSHAWGRREDASGWASRRSLTVLSS